eukprot:snap_masked-scaffold_3-processed-gene-21.60-mRNA-1 protein AED:1.00 eAED:1.00 QI:0/0/0/0/1/1/2/0/361
MCLTWSGKSQPEEELCGSHGTCIEGVCVCSSGWSNSLDLNHGYLGQNDYKNILRELKNESEVVTVEDFSEQLLLSSPCSKYDPFMTTIFSLSVIVCSVALIFSFYNKATQRIKAVHFFRTIALVHYIIYALLKLIKGNEAHEIFNLGAGWTLGVFFTCMNATIIFYLYKHLQYQVSKAKKLYTLRVSLFGYGISQLLTIQAGFALILNVFIFFFLHNIAPFYVWLIHDENLESEDFVDLLILYHRIFIYGFIGFYLVLLLLSEILLKSFVEDLKAVRDRRKMNNYSVSISESEERTTGWQDRLDSVLVHISSIRCAIKFQSFVTASLLCSLATFPSLSPLMQYSAHFGLGLIFPIHSLRFH